MDISKIDSNFKPTVITNCDQEIEWHAIEEDVFSLHGVFYSHEDGLYLRMPLDVAKQVSANVEYLCTNTAGGRIRFRTDSKLIAYQVVEPKCVAMPHMPLTGQMGFGLYCDDKYEGTFSPLAKDLEGENIEFNGFHYTIYPKEQGQFYDYDLYFPLYNGVKKIYVGVAKGSKFETPRQYKNKSPILYYGSSITQGGCAGHPGNDYQGHIARAVNYDYINLGFSGSAKGEKEMVDYITTIPHSLFVMDYDHNAPTVEHLEKTHYAFYKRYREKCKDTPIIFLNAFEKYGWSA
jgi:hypothetical protein